MTAGSAQVSCMTERVTAWLGPDGEAMGLFGHGNAFHLARRGVDGINDVVKPAGQPQRLSVGANVAHVRTAATGHRPRIENLTSGEINDRNAAFAARRSKDFVGAAIGDVKLGPIPTRVESMRAHSGLEEADLGEFVAVNQKHSVGLHVGNVENLSVG